MSDNDVLQLVSFILVISALTLVSASYLVNVFRRRAMGVDAVFGSIERMINTLIGQQGYRLQGWKEYACSVLMFNFVGGLFLFSILLMQNFLPFNPQNYPALSPDLAFTIAASFVANTDWQPYSGEMTLSLFSQMAGLTVQNFLSAATGLAVAFAVIRGFTYRENSHVGNFYADVVRVTIYILLPLAIILSLLLVWQGAPQNLEPFIHATTLENTSQTIAQGSVASQTAISLLGSNGGGFFNTNAAHPYANPTPLSNFIEIIAMLLLPISLVIAFGELVSDKRQGWALLLSMSILFAAFLSVSLYAESMKQPALETLNVDQRITETNLGGNMEGKEARFGVFDSVLWNTSAIGTKNGAVNSTLENYTPLALVISTFNLMVGCVIYGGIGSGLYSILAYALIAVFMLGLMSGRTPEYLGKKIEQNEIKYAAAALLISPICILVFSYFCLISTQGAKSITAYGAHGLTQALFTYASVASGNGSSFSGFNGNTPYQNIVLALISLISRFGVITCVLAISGSFASKKILAASDSATSTHGISFIIMLTSFIVLFGGIAFFPTLVLGPVAEHLTLFGTPG